MNKLLNKDKLKEYLDFLVDKYKTPDFIKNDPLRFPYRYDDYHNREVMAFIASMMAQGKRTNIVSSIEKLENLMYKRPYDFITNFDYNREIERFKDFNHFAYKNIPGLDILTIFYLLQQVLHKYKNLKELFLQGLNINKHKNVKEALIFFTEMLFSFEAPPNNDYMPIPNRVKSLLPNPRKGSACKRLNMFLRWVVRKDNVDLGLWTEVPTSMLIIPLDFHVSKLSRELGLTKRNQDNWITAEEITDNLKIFDSNDPTKYDFAIFGIGISGDKINFNY
ncbi:MAG: TIGR02757 family protein [Candidatus Sericytochromatia bacterium]|nr:MAG: TIGR02757 family protein [Candidatus Sericytochromatia bacterium]